jgi:hypothetical protein
MGQAAYLMAFLEDAWAECALRELVEECFGRNEAGRTSAYNSDLLWSQHSVARYLIRLRVTPH